VSDFSDVVDEECAPQSRSIFSYEDLAESSPADTQKHLLNYRIDTYSEHLFHSSVLEVVEYLKNKVNPHS
jgi:hypothetical protein